jgi:hypothetical protein
MKLGAALSYISKLKLKDCQSAEGQLTDKAVVAVMSVEAPITRLEMSKVSTAQW